MRSWGVSTVVGAVAGLSACALAAPQAGLVSRSWTLDFEFHDPQRITVNGVSYWYVVYEVTNRTGKDVEFFPSFRLVTDTLQVVEGGAEVNPVVYDAIGARHRNEYPFFAPPSKITGLMLQGDENARASAAVFRTFDPTAAGFTMYAGGLSGEVEQLRNPSFDAKRPVSDENPQSFLLRRTLVITYSLPGDAQTRALAAPIRRSRAWEMK